MSYSHIKPSTRYHQVEGLYEKFMDEDPIKLVPITQINKRQGGLPYERYKNYMNARTMKECIGLGATHEDNVLNYTAGYMIFISEDEVVKDRYVKSPPRARKRLNGVSKVPANNEIIIQSKKPSEDKGEYHVSREELIEYNCKLQEELDKLKKEKESEYHIEHEQLKKSYKDLQDNFKELRIQYQTKIGDATLEDNTPCIIIDELKKDRDNFKRLFRQKVKEIQNILERNKKYEGWEEDSKKWIQTNKKLHKENEKYKIDIEKLEEKVSILEKVEKVKDTKKLKKDYDKLNSDHADCVSHWEEDIKEKEHYKSQVSLFENLLEIEKEKNNKLKREAEKVINLWKKKNEKLKKKKNKKESNPEVVADLLMKISRLEKKIKNK